MGSRPFLTRRDSATTRPSVFVELLVVVALYWLYDLINGFSPNRALSAEAHGRSVLKLERMLEFDRERFLNSWVQAHHVLAYALADYYDLAHFSVTLVVIIGTWWLAPDAYPALRNALIGINLIGFIVFWCYPVAPPRLLGGAGFHDVVASSHAIWSWHSGVAAHANEFAAMPSLHMAWAVWCGVAVWTCTTRSVWRALACAHVALTVVAVIGTGNHFMLDVIAGGATTLFAFLVASRFASRRAAVAPAVVECESGFPTTGERRAHASASRESALRADQHWCSACSEGLEPQPSDP